MSVLMLSSKRSPLLCLSCFRLGHLFSPPCSPYVWTPSPPDAERLVQARPYSSISQHEDFTHYKSLISSAPTPGAESLPLGSSHGSSCPLLVCISALGPCSHLFFKPQAPCPSGCPEKAKRLNKPCSLDLWNQSFPFRWTQGSTKIEKII